MMDGWEVISRRKEWRDVKPELRKMDKLIVCMSKTQSNAVCQKRGTVPEFRTIIPSGLFAKPVIIL